MGRGGAERVLGAYDAARTHFDFRLEADGVLGSWSVPKRPSGDRHDRRLAMPTEDHPLIVWGEGRYENRSADEGGRAVPFAEALDAGHDSFRLVGRRLGGDRALTRFREGARGWEREAEVA
ncbi:DNA polymerase ligase N-terminal domain-containing protein [Streptomyces sp. NPDC057854]|uniref:DNA polymerase ligase N-terminal domain-containing protein n=1 Tax=unclassified Streptomyces TaxID=2593676 RepID=UPI003681B129